MRSFRKYYSRALEAEPERLHFAAHSHHPWPDCSREAHVKYWDDSAQRLDEKWDYLFSDVFPRARRHIAELIGTSDPSRICIGANVHDFLVRILSCFEPGKPLRVLTTDGEFHSFARQIARYEELPNVSVTRVPVEPHDTLTARLIEAARGGAYDLFYVSHVFFNSGLRLRDLDDIVKAAPPDPIIVVDGYHAFCALPFSIRAIEERVFYTAGGYKYAQTGEGMCFLHVPKGCTLRPLDTGWFAAFGAMTSDKAAEVTYAEDGWRFAGATLDPAGTYRFNAVMDWWKEIGITVGDVHEHVQALKQSFIDRLDLKRLKKSDLILPASGLNDGHFLTFRLPNAGALQTELAEARIITDSRADRLRFGFGLHQDEPMLEALFSRLRSSF